MRNHVEIRIKLSIFLQDKLADFLCCTLGQGVYTVS